MPPLTLVTSVNHTDSTPLSSEPPALARVIEIGEVAAGIAVPEDRGVRFFSASRDFDGLDGRLFRNPEQAAKAVRDLTRTGVRRALRPVA